MKLPTLQSTGTEPPAFGHLAAVHLRTPDLEGSLRFYAGLLALPLVRTEPAPRRYFLRLGSALLVLEEGEPAQGAGPVLQLGLAVADLPALEALHKRLLASGVPVSGLEEHGYARLFRFRDPISGIILHAAAPGHALGPQDLCDGEPPPYARELLGSGG